MSRKVDPKNVTKEDVPYLRDRPWMIDEFRRQGFVEQMDAVVDGEPVRPSPEDESKIHTDQMRVGTQAPQQLDARKSGVVADGESDEIDDNYEEWSVADLKEEISVRNSERSEDTQIALSGNKADLVARLHKADEEEQAAASA